jgi:putative ABC transport system substrate-binding protein
MSILLARRKFVAGLGGAAAWPIAAWAQQPAMPVIGFVTLGEGQPRNAKFYAAFHKGLAEQGYVESRNLLIEYRFAKFDFGRVPELVADLVRRQVVVIVAPGNAAAKAAKAATSSIPVVFFTSGDPVENGLVPSLNRPGGNLTGIAAMSVEVEPKRFGLLRELLPHAERFAVLVNSTSPNTEALIRDAQAAAKSIGGQIEILDASTSREIDAAFADLSQRRADALLVSPNTFLLNRSTQIVTLAALHRLPAIYSDRDSAEIGGLMSYGTDTADQSRQVGALVGRILKARSRRICRCSKQQSSSLSSTSKPPRHSGSWFRPPCSPSPTR